MSKIPVPLTEVQIEEIIGETPKPTGVGKNALNIARRHFANRLRALLKTISLVPNPEAFLKFKQGIILSAYESHVEAGSPVGVTGGVSLGGPLTQLSLNSFHFAGAVSGVALAFQKVRDFLTGSRMMRDPQMKIFFRKVSPEYHGTDLHDTKHVGTFESITQLKPVFEHISVRDIVEDHGDEILTYEEAAILGVPEMLKLHAQIRPYRITQPEKFKMSNVLSLRLNTYRMYTHGITMGMVATAIEGPTLPLDSVIVVWRSHLAGRIFVLADETKDYGQRTLSPEVVIPMFFDNLKSKFDDLKVSGITGIQSIEPQAVDVTRGIYQIIPVEGTREHKVYTNNRRTRVDGISLADLHYLFMVAGFKVLPITANNTKYLYITVEYERNDLQKELEKRITKAKEEKKTPEQLELIRATQFYIGMTRGSNMDEIVWHDDIDLFRTTGNHSHDISETLGIDAAQLYMITRFQQMFADFGASINPRHISLIFNLLCNLGMVNSLSFTGINRRNVGALAMASYEKSVEVMIQSASFAAKDTVDGVSPSLYLAQRSGKVGTGSIQVMEDLSIIPKGKPGLPSIDEVSVIGEVVEEQVYPSFDDMFGEQSVFARFLIKEKVDKVAIETASKISAEPFPLPDETVLPGGAKLVMASTTLLEALKQVTVGTPIDIEVVSGPEEIPDITTLTEFEVTPLKRFQPAVEEPVLEVPIAIPQPQRIETSAIPRPDFVEGPGARTPSVVATVTKVKATLPGRAPGPVIPPPRLSHRPKIPTMRSVAPMPSAPEPILRPSVSSVSTPAPSAPMIIPSVSVAPFNTPEDLFAFLPDIGRPSSQVQKEVPRASYDLFIEAAKKK